MLYLIYSISGCSVAVLSLQACLRALASDGYLRANEGVLVPLRCKMSANIVKRWLSSNIRNCAAHPVPAILAFVRPDKIDWTVSDSLDSLAKFEEATSILVPAWHGTSSMTGRRGDTLPGSSYAKARPRYVGKFWEENLSREFAQAVWARSKTDGTKLEAIKSLAEQRFLCKSWTAIERVKQLIESKAWTITGILEVLGQLKKWPRLAFTASGKRCISSVRTAARP